MWQYFLFEYQLKSLVAKTPFHCGKVVMVLYQETFIFHYSYLAGMDDLMSYCLIKPFEKTSIENSAIHLSI